MNHTYKIKLVISRLVKDRMKPLLPVPEEKVPSSSTTVNVVKCFEQH